MQAPLAIVLAAGKSTRMKSDLPKVLHLLCGKPLLMHVLSAVRGAGVQRIVVVVGHKAELVREALAGQSDIEYALQENPQGTGHAVMMCRANLQGHDGPVLVLAGDMPLIQSSTLTRLLDEQRSARAACVIGTAVTENNHGLGRVVRDANRKFQRIVEQKDATPDEAAITEINSGCYVFAGPALVSALDNLKPNNKQGEYYLTDCPAILLAAGKTVVASCTLDIREAMGVNTQEELAAAERALAS